MQDIHTFPHGYEIVITADRLRVRNSHLQLTVDLTRDGLDALISSLQVAKAERTRRSACTTNEGQEP